MNNRLKFDTLHRFMQFKAPKTTTILVAKSPVTSSVKMALDPIKHNQKKAQDNLVAHTGAWTQDSNPSPSKTVVCLALLHLESLANREDFQGRGKSRRR